MEKVYTYGLARIRVVYSAMGRTKSIIVRFSLNGTIEEFIIHVEQSMGLALKGNSKKNHERTGRASNKKLFMKRDSRGCLSHRLDQDHRGSTLAECGIRVNSVLYMEGSRTIGVKSNALTINVKIQPDDPSPRKYRVSSNTTVLELKHQIQDSMGIPVSKQELVDGANRDKVVPDNAPAVQTVTSTWKNSSGQGALILRVKDSNDECQQAAETHSSEIQIERKYYELKYNYYYDESH